MNPLTPLDGNKKSTEDKPKVDASSSSVALAAPIEAIKQLKERYNASI